LEAETSVRFRLTLKLHANLVNGFRCILRQAVLTLFSV
jgi:hypothetical protein